MDIPQTTIQFPKLEEIAIEKVSVEVPSVKKFALPSVTPVVDFQPAAIDLPGETIPQFQTNFKVTAHPEPMEKMAVPQMTMPEQAHVALQLPETFLYSQYPFRKAKFLYRKFIQIHLSI